MKITEKITENVAYGKPDYFYLRYVTLGEFFTHLRVVVPVWLGLSVVWVGLRFMDDAAKTSPNENTFFKDVPRLFWLWLVIAVFTWVLEGKTVTFPRLNFLDRILLN